MRFDAEIMLRNDVRVLTETIEHPVAEGAWTDRDVEVVLTKILRAIARSTPALSSASIIRIDVSESPP